VANRPIGLILRTAADPAHLRGLARAFRVYEQPVRALARYVTARGGYPWVARLHTPLGPRPVRCRSWHDVVTVHEIFARRDYAVVAAPATMLDCGANIGVASLWALTSRPDARVRCVEPVESNLDELRRTLAGLEGRYELEPVAVAAESGEVDFGVDRAGRYGGIGRDTGHTIRTRARAIAELVDECVERWGRIGLLKLDVEGAEIPILRALDRERLERVDAIAVEHQHPLPDDLPLEGYAARRQVDIHQLRRR
jgi:FkbM family methyltransferase